MNQHDDYIPFAFSLAETIEREQKQAAKAFKKIIENRGGKTNVQVHQIKNVGTMDIE